MTQNYKLSDEGDSIAALNGTANPNWFRPTVDPQAIRALMQKSDAMALRDTALWLGALIVSATIAIALWPSWWSAPFWIIYGVLYGSGADSRWHECGHKTAFKTPWMNAVVYQIACFMMMRNPVVWRASHVRHHTDTVVVGRDPEIVAMRPPDLLRVALAFTGVVDVYHAFKSMILHASGRIAPQEAMYVATKDHARLFFGRAHLVADLCCHRRHITMDGIDIAADVDRPAASVRGVASCDDGAATTPRAGRKRVRSSVEHANCADEPCQPLYLSQHELSP